MGREQHPGGDWITLAVRYTGIGMGAESLAKLLSSFTKPPLLRQASMGGRAWTSP